MSSPRNAVPDLLKRFVPTPYKIIAKGTVIETNDRSLFELLDDNSLQEAVAAVAPGFHIRIFREERTSTPVSDIQVFCTGAICVVTVAHGNIFMTDHEESRMYSFLNSEIKALDLVQVYLPMARNHGNGTHL